MQAVFALMSKHIHPALWVQTRVVVRCFDHWHCEQGVCHSIHTWITKIHWVLLWGLPVCVCSHNRRESAIMKCKINYIQSRWFIEYVPPFIFLMQHSGVEFYSDSRAGDVRFRSIPIPTPTGGSCIRGMVAQGVSKDCIFNEDFRYVFKFAVGAIVYKLRWQTWPQKSIWFRRSRSRMEP